nr:GNAT family N-acetyltransferase [Bacteroidota bacterium]
MVTSRITLRPIDAADLSTVHQLFSLPETDKYNTLGIPPTIDDTKKIMDVWLDAQKIIPREKYIYYAMNEKKEFVGIVGINIGKPKYRLAELWYKLHPVQWNKGYATEIVNSMIKYCFEDLKLHRVEAGCAFDNTASIKVLLKAGMQHEGMRRKMLPIRGNWIDGNLYAILEEDFFNSK